MAWACHPTPGGVPWPFDEDCQVEFLLVPPAGFNPVLPLVDVNAAPPVQRSLMPLLGSPIGGRFPIIPSRDPAIRQLVNGLPVPADLLAGNTVWQDPYLSADTQPFIVGVSVLRDNGDAIDLGAAPYHFELP